MAVSNKEAGYQHKVFKIDERHRSYAPNLYQNNIVL